MIKSENNEPSTPVSASAKSAIPWLMAFTQRNRSIRCLHPLPGSFGIRRGPRSDPGIVPTALAEAVMRTSSFGLRLNRTRMSLRRFLRPLHGKTIFDVTNPTACPLRDGRTAFCQVRLAGLQWWKVVKQVFQTICRRHSDQESLPYMVAGESCSWRRLYAPKRRLVRLPENLGFCAIQLAGFSEVGLLVQRT